MEWYHVMMIIFSNFAILWTLNNNIAKEMKDFHGRLCKLEEKYYQWLMRDKP